MHAYYAINHDSPVKRVLRSTVAFGRRRVVVVLVVLSIFGFSTSLVSPLVLTGLENFATLILHDVPCTVTVSGSQQTGTCSGKFQPESGTGTGSTSSNLIANSTFVTGIAGWSGWQSTLLDVQLASAPSGYAAKVTQTSGTDFSIGNFPGITPTTAGVTYSASVDVAAASPSAVGKQVQLVIREWTPDGTILNESGSPLMTLTNAFQTLAAGPYTTGDSNGDLDIYVVEFGAAAGDAFYADDVVLTSNSAASTTTPSASATPVPTPSAAASATPTPTPLPTATPAPSATPVPTATSAYAVTFIGDTVNGEDVTLQIGATAGVVNVEVDENGTRLTQGAPVNGAATLTVGPLASGANTLSVVGWPTPPGGGGTPTATLTVGPITIAATSTASSPSASGPTGDPGSWSMVFDDEFNTGSLNTSVWSPDWFGSGSTSNGTVMLSSDVSVGANGLALQLNSPQSGGLVSTNPDDGQPGHTGFQIAPTAGHPVFVEYEATLPATSTGSGVANWPALWLDGQTWPEDGEIDIMEGGYGGVAYHVHYGTGSGSAQGSGVGGNFAGTHTFGVLWSTTALTFYYDGVNVGTVDVALTSPEYLLAENSYSSADPTVFPTTMYIRYVRVWQS